MRSCQIFFCDPFEDKILVVHIQGVIESCTDILTTSYWLHVELGKKYLKNFMSKNKIDIYFLSYNFFKLLLVFYVVLQPGR
jgi:hypothetical protein